MKYTSAEVAKLLRKLNEEVENLEEQEAKRREFNAAMGEDIETVRPAYDYADTQRKLEKLQAKNRMVKHALNCFNVATEVPGFGMTIDQLLVYIPQLSRRKQKLAMMSSCLPKERAKVSGFGSQIIDYRYANYDIEAVKADYQRVSDELAKAQTALDLVNTTMTMEIEID